MPSELKSLIRQKRHLLESLDRGYLYTDFDRAYDKLPRRYKHLAEPPETVLDTTYKGKKFFLHTDDIPTLREEVYALNWIIKTMYYCLDVRAAMVSREYRKYFKRKTLWMTQKNRLTSQEYTELNLFREWLLNSGAYDNATATGNFSFIEQTEEIMRPIYFSKKSKPIPPEEWEEEILDKIWADSESKMNISHSAGYTSLEGQ
jgi:hypothetical protein